MYDAFNERDMDTAMGQMAVDVDWPKGWEPGRARGRDGLRDYWGRMWASVDATVQPLGFACRADGTIAVEVQRVVRDLDGRLIDQQRALHVHAMRDGLVTRMTWRSSATAPDRRADLTFAPLPRLRSIDGARRSAQATLSFRPAPSKLAGRPC